VNTQQPLLFSRHSSLKLSLFFLRTAAFTFFAAIPHNVHKDDGMMCRRHSASSALCAHSRCPKGMTDLWRGTTWARSKLMDALITRQAVGSLSLGGCLGLVSGCTKPFSSPPQLHGVPLSHDMQV